ncbi:MAG: hypothetical protein Q8869_02760, partial [Candidatus Phytoplasma australasiaticum]|nr:hypothetical protein [Candidatus Phytoplasma australasiaticum]
MNKKVEYLTVDCLIFEKKFALALLGIIKFLLLKQIIHIFNGLCLRIIIFFYLSGLENHIFSKGEAV